VSVRGLRQTPEDADIHRVDDLISVRRWRRYGADRLYVTQECGAPVGSIDLQSGEVVVAEPGFEDDVRRAAQEYLRADVAELVLPARPHALAEQADTRQVEAALEEWLGTTGGPEDGPRAERASTVGDRLDRLIEEGWQTVHDVPLGRQGSLVEHLLIGPGGLFTVTERRHRGQVVRARGRAMHVDGRPVAYLRDARLEAARVADRLAGPQGSWVVAPARRLASAQQSALMLREGPRRPSHACETGDWSHVDVYLTKTLDYRMLLLPGSAYQPELMRWVAERGSTVVAVGADVEGAAAAVRYPGDDVDDVRLLTETTVAELVAARWWAAS